MQKQSQGQNIEIRYQENEERKIQASKYKRASTNIKKNFKIGILSTLICKAIFLPVQIKALKKYAATYGETFTEHIKDPKKLKNIKNAFAIDFIGYPLNQGILFGLYEAFKQGREAKGIKMKNWHYFIIGGTVGFITFPFTSIFIHLMEKYYLNVKIKISLTERIDIFKCMWEIYPYRAFYFGMFEIYRRTQFFSKIAQTSKFISYTINGLLSTFIASLVQNVMGNTQKILNQDERTTGNDKIRQFLNLRTFPGMRPQELFIRCQNGALSLSLFYYIKEQFFTKKNKD